MENIGSNSYLSQTEASSLAGVSAATLMRFAEAGYFRVLQQNGQTRFSRQEIFEVFGPAISTSLPKPEGFESDSYISGGKTSSSDTSNNAASGGAAARAEAPITEISADNSKGKEETSILKSNSLLAAQVEKIIDQPLESSIHDSSYYSDHKISEVRSEISAENPGSPQPMEAFKRVLQLQEELLVQKESRIRELAQERDWLRSRLEKMEDKSDRDQMLLMVESQKVRTLIDKGPAKSGIIKLALDWFGGAKENGQENKSPASEQK